MDPEEFRDYTQEKHDELLSAIWASHSHLDYHVWELTSEDVETIKKYLRDELPDMEICKRKEPESEPRGFLGRSEEFVETNPKGAWKDVDMEPKELVDSVDNATRKAIKDTGRTYQYFLKEDNEGNIRGFCISGFYVEGFM